MYSLSPELSLESTTSSTEFFINKDNHNTTDSIKGSLYKKAGIGYKRKHKISKTLALC